MSTGISAGVDNFSLHLFVYFFVTIIIFYELASVTSATSNERMTMDVIFAGATPINELTSSYTSKLCISICLPYCTAYILALLATIWKYGKSTRDSACTPRID